MNLLKKPFLIGALFCANFLIAQNDNADKPQIKVGGALIFNYTLSSYNDGQKNRGGDFGLDHFKITAEGEYKGVKLNAEYRLYSSDFGGGILKQGWFGYDFNEKDNLQVGLTQVPFGITPYNSTNWFYSINYFIGLEEDYDMGIKYTHKGEKWQYALAFFKNAEELRFGNNSDASYSRYSYDVSSIDSNDDGTLDLRYKEVNQFNGKVEYLFGKDKTKHRIGASLLYGGLYNLDTEKTKSHYALAAHYHLVANKWDFKAQVSNYKYNTENENGESSNVIGVAAFGSPYLISSEGTSYTFGASYTLPVNWKPISSLQFYNDFSHLSKGNYGFEDTMMNVTGVLITAGNIYTYVDFAAGKNQPWLGPVWTRALADGTPNADWHFKFNVNIAYYF
ncbi:porin [Tenacibaculum ovolyticum]|uniref:porin n=1 Tax=Tenacibaculum ovolyticum TaxID=104270 RepID=UPI003BACF50F